MKPTQKRVRIHPSKEEPILTRGHGYSARHRNEPTVLIPLEQIKDEREI